jgi:peptidoglycan/LPS O-acetylase OafA/YrhL
MSNPESAATTEKPSRPASKIHALTSARFFAALYVVFYHTHLGVRPNSTLDHFISLGDSSVTFFFVLSGYILAFVYLRESKPIATRNFYVSRFARIYPLYVAAMVIDLPFAISYRIGQYGLLHATERVLLLFLISLFFQQIWIQASAGINAPGWSLGIEAIFYLSFPFLGLWLWKLKRRYVPIAALLAAGLGIAAGLLVPYRLSYSCPAASLISYMSQFALGVLVAKWQFSAEPEQASQSSNAAKGWLAIIASVVLFLLIVAAVQWFNRHGIRPFFLLAPLFAITIWALANTQILPVRLLSASWLMVLGEASYGLYLLHIPVFHLFRFFKWDSSPWAYIPYLTISIGLSVLSFYWFETPIRRSLLTRFKTHTRESTETASAAQ